MDETLLQEELKAQFLAVHGDKGYGGRRIDRNPCLHVETTFVALIEQFSQMASGRPAAIVAEAKEEVV